MTQQASGSHVSQAETEQSTRGPFPRWGHMRGGATHPSGPSDSQPSLLIQSWNCLFQSYCGARGCQMLARYHISVTLRTGCCVPKKEKSPETGGNDVLGGIGGLCYMMKDPVRGRRWGLERGCIQILRVPFSSWAMDTGISGPADHGDRHIQS